MSSTQPTNQPLDQPQDHTTVTSNVEHQSTPSHRTSEQTQRPAGLGEVLRRTGGFRPNPNPSLTKTSNSNDTEDIQRIHSLLIAPGFPTAERLDEISKLWDSIGQKRGLQLKNHTDSSTRTQTSSNDIINPDDIMSSSQSNHTSLGQTNNPVDGNPNDQSTPALPGHEESQSTTTQSSSN
ncbi:uncharacterized protein MELLADRAFT_60155 [Melampsora larici-populina 98AG31]|uniref:Uncharacterized protein n=1 Tax=Melampsora larici-populina (strain 98AG31 / pathotype 3-4-7) TaxID=747676 RepID=F4RAA6_MELLP|nr:uncharacterized protein MELLADRAFT_60155 [Melampsora larici-populina 98AG31]EGG10814.1 hypothetical protein MELLADRAFT_60155 [Melampsora larici-populina 98AG31]